MDSPNIDIQLIERVVREVLAALAEVPSSPAETTGEKRSSLERSEAQAAARTQSRARKDAGESSVRLARVYSTRDGELTLPNKVVTVATLENRLAGIRQVVLPPGAIVTPAAQDVLAEKGIKVFFGPASREEPGISQVTDGTKMPVADAVTILLVTRRVSTQQLENLLRPEGIIAEYESLDCLIRVSDRVAEVCQAGKLAVVLTRYVSTELCLANRHPGVRAIAGRAGIDVAAETAAVGANALVADAAAGLFALKRMITGFVRGPHVCPENLRERLELS